MKKSFALIAVCIIMISNTVHSQKGRFGINAGTTISSYKVKSDLISLTSKSRPGITIGIFSDIPLGRSASLIPALNFVQKGGTLNADGYKDKLTTNYLEVPLNFVYNLKTTTGKFFFGAGPSVNVGLSGKDKVESNGSSETEKVKFGKDKDFKRLESSLNFITGYNTRKGIAISFNYNTAFTNAVDNEDGDGKFYNRYFAVKIGFIL